MTKLLDSETRELLEFIARKTSGGLCQMTARGKHEFLRDIAERLTEVGHPPPGYVTRKELP